MTAAEVRQLVKDLEEHERVAAYARQERLLMNDVPKARAELNAQIERECVNSASRGEMAKTVAFSHTSREVLILLTPQLLRDGFVVSDVVPTKVVDPYISVTW